MKDQNPTSTAPRGPERPAAKAPQPNTLPAQGETQQPVPRRAFERDESADSQVADEPSMKEIGRVAKRDADRGIPDTTRGAELDRTYDKLREDLPDGQKKSTP
ncbi:hypothetical protein [Ramlibacter rhizophilus]|uniref:Uncharacterized protein n=1 Tax=Ramlibacter rhizophilus TaxID=1781167 RepID=A0A4Z0BH54_9BURK|nr:hypothetical protein [Ramlibacter rhizophilus]TFY98120.1 hypothetical protein EZ242_16895 [Ramlibacter rhizophilus]